MRHGRVRKYKFHHLATLSFALAAAVGLCIWLFFQSVWMSLLLTGLVLPVIVWKVRGYLMQRFTRRVEKAFSNVLVFLSGSLIAGNRLERCIGEIAESRAPETSILQPEFERMNQLLRLNWPVERVFEDFAARYDVGDIRVFSVALSAGIPAGINLVELVRQVSATLRVKCDTEEEIHRVLNLPKYNNRIVLAMPFLSVFAMRMMAASYAASLDTGIGRVIMAVACLLLGLAVVLGDLLGQIRY